MNKTNFMSKKVYSLPVIPYLETRSNWVTGKTEEADPVFSFSWRRVEAVDKNGSKSWSLDPTNFNVFAIREALFSIRGPEDALRFFEAFGPWQIKQHLGTEAGIIRFSGLIRQRDFYKDALLSREIWSSSGMASGEKQIRAAFEDLFLWSPLAMEMAFQQPPVVTICCRDIQEALRASVFLDRLDGFPWRRCAREDCGKVFKLESKRARLYCSMDCAHLQSVRRYNERKRAEAAKARKVKSKPGQAGRTTRKGGE